MHSYYKDERYCEICKEYTNQICRDSTHERDSSEDYQICLTCYSDRDGYSGKWHTNTQKPDWLNDLE